MRILERVLLVVVVCLPLAAQTTSGSQFSDINSTINFTSLTNPAITNLYARPDGSVNNINGFGTVSGARDPRIM